MARAQKPSIIFIDEIDSLVSARSDGEHEASRRVKTEFLVQMQGVGGANETGVLVLGATNLPWALDPAMRRRFEKRIYIPLPDVGARLSLLSNSMKNEDHCMTEQDFLEIAQNTDTYSGSDLNALIKNACFEPLRKFQTAVYFREVGRNARGAPIWMPCAPSEGGATMIDKATIKPDEIRKNVINKYDFIKARDNTKPTVSLKDLVTYEKWTTDFGMDG